MARRWFCLLAALCLLVPLARAEEAPDLPHCQTVEQVEALLLYPGDGTEPVAAERGLIRYISQDTDKDPSFCPDYWMGGEPGGELDLTIEKSLKAGSFNKPYTYYARNMCTRAVYSMALSYLGIDLTPGAMSAMLEKRDIDMHYEEVTDRLPEVEIVTFTHYVFFQMFEAYQSDSRYSPVYLYIRRPSGTTHCLLVVARQENGRYIVVDPRYHDIKDEPVHVYTISLNKVAQKIGFNSDFRSELNGSYVLRCCQWRLVEEE